ncbi:hypothetical protein EGY01_10785 [Enterococcus faecium]|uniref:hypothetical protein n=1 Tax=Enterococcus faecium TaxID=1352 RepID=UPI000F4E3546|nr:hypothetical protein [Enterococcus faecium]ROW93313.1 hypothetical protein EGW09_12680 [Enterococcus faecium]ROX28508.1 hypothetical protein EGW27_10935 [Enterococcus faecium]ROX45711.1 hypothetical protein EGW18_12680 [Enterococcus faecium]ROX76696.1 hypothetical protein EGW38_12535 [Enterococcus faecium]ROX85492.1 hypothetical protein EGW47_10935 [Enterococcus faecium]
MNQFNKEIAQALLENTNLTEVFRNQLESTMNSLLESELTAILGYDPYVRFNRIRQKSPILYRWVMNAVRYEGYRW